MLIKVQEFCSATEEYSDRFTHIVNDDWRLNMFQDINGTIITRENVENAMHNKLGIMNVSVRWAPTLIPFPKLTRVIMSLKNLTLFENDSADLYEDLI